MVQLSWENTRSLQKINEICTGDRAEIINSDTDVAKCFTDTFDTLGEIKEKAAGQIITRSQK